MKNPSSRTRLLGLALALVLISLIAGDRTRAQTAFDVGIDPLSVLDLQVKANAVVVLDSSGSMREVPTVSNMVTGISNGELVADDPKSKMAQAKSVLQQIIQDNDQKVKFRFLMYDEPDSYSLVSDDRFYYATSDTNAAALQINPDLTGSASPGISRRTSPTTCPTPGPTPCPTDDVTIGGTPWHYLRASQFWNGETINTAGKVILGVADPKPRVFLRNDTLDTPCTMPTAECVQFDFMGANFTRGAGGTCQTDKELVPLAGCGQVDQYTNSIGNYLQPELKITTTGAIDGYDNATPATMPTQNGIRAVGGTPIALSLTEIKTWFNGIWTSMASDTTVKRKPRTFVVFVTDGDDQCSDFAPLTGDAAYDQNALKAAYRAEQLYKNADTSTVPDPLSSVTTYVVVYGGAAGVKRANWIAWAGSGLSVPATSDADTDAKKRWSREPTAAEVADCKAKGGCTDAFTAGTVGQLEKAVQSAIDQGSGSGQFAASAVVAEPIWEYGGDAGLDPWGDPERRFDAFTTIVFQPTFDASNFDGRLTAWGYGASAPIKKWEAGSKLANADSATSPGTPGIYIAKGPSTGCPTGAAVPCPTFAKLRGTTLSDALIKRRIYTSSRNGVFSGATERTATQLWPPAATVAPADNTAGTLDRALGIVGAGTAAEFTSLQTEYGACAGSPLHPDCSSADLAIQIARARREAREVILAHMAGADPQLTAGGNPVRCEATATAAACDYAGSIVYRRRSWVLAESTNATPAVVSAPLQIEPQNHLSDYDRLRDGVWSGSTNLNVGLRNPDKVDKSRSDRSTVIANANYKPIMTVTYLATNGMLHAFRAGPCINSTMTTTPGSCPLSTAVSGSYNTGGEELWGFVPFDQLRKLRELRQPPKRDPHTYMLASSLRIADIYEPTGTTTGEWRVVLYFGRGLGGKYLTALDITNPGPASMAAFDATPAQAAVEPRQPRHTRRHEHG